MTLTKHHAPLYALAAILFAIAFAIPGLVKTILIILTLGAGLLTYESFRDRDVAPGLVFALSTLVIGFLAMVSA